jgi:allantoicase
MKDFTELVDLASERLGGKVLEANDEFFAPKENLLKPSKPVFREGEYTTRGKWMDGWETRRRRTPGHDWCIVRLGIAGMIRGVVVDTTFFKGNHPEQVSLDACDMGHSPRERTRRDRPNVPSSSWVELLPRTTLRGDAQNSFPIEHPGRVTHLRVNIYPDGGVSRLRVHGEVVPDRARVSRRDSDLAAIENGGKVIASSDQFFGVPLNLLMPGRPKNMGDGWETRRRRGPGHDWVIVKLGVPGAIERIEVDTAHFKGNFPESCSLEACYADEVKPDGSTLESYPWSQLVSRTGLRADHRHILRPEPRDAGTVTHVRFNIYPDGGVSRLRIFGHTERPEDRRKGIERFNHLPRVQALQALLACCGSRKWVEAMLAERPFPSLERLLEVADTIWMELDREDWLEAFRHHPPIGQSKAKRKQLAMARRWSAGEQSVAQQAGAETLAVLAAANQAYRATFGHVFLICAAGKTGEEVLENLQQRLSNDPAVELRIASGEQRKITRLRLEKLLES